MFAPAPTLTRALLTINPSPPGSSRRNNTRNKINRTPVGRVLD
jgi:hypothetical protein